MSWTDDPNIMAVHNLAAAVGTAFRLSDMTSDPPRSTTKSFLDMFDAVNEQLPAGPVRDAMAAAVKMQRDTYAEATKR